MKAFLKSIRWFNLLMIIGMMFIFRYCIIGSIFKAYGIQLLMPFKYFLALVISITLIAAAAYLINDFFDIENDRANNKNVVIDTLSINFIFRFYAVANILALVLSTWLSFKIGYPKLAVIFFLFAGLGWFYSNAFQKVFLLGNIIVSISVAAIPLLLGVVEMLYTMKHFGYQLYIHHVNPSIPMKWMIGYSIFAFMFTLIREIVKDAQDMIGDAEVGSSSVPITLGVKKTKILVTVLHSLTIVLLAWVFHTYLDQFWSNLYFVLFLVLPNFMALYLEINADNHTDFARLSLLHKIIMLTGIFYAFVACYIFQLAN